jgi:hypothetical protein
MRNYRIVNGHVPPLNPETSKPSRSDTWYALNVTAFVVAVAAVLLWFGGWAALVSALGLNFTTENLELRDGLKAVLGYSPLIGLGGELALFVLVWTAVKVLCLNAGGVNGSSMAAVAMAAVATAAVAVTTAAVATEVVATATVVVTMAAVVTAVAAKTATTATMAVAMTAAAVTVAAVAESMAVAATGKAVTMAVTMAASVVAVATVTAAAVSSKDIGGNSNGGGHRQQSTNIGSKDTVAVGTAIETAAAGAATTAAGAPTTAPGVGADGIAFATAWKGCGCRL